MRLRCKVCGKEYEIDEVLPDQDEAVEESVGQVRCDRI